MIIYYCNGCRQDWQANKKYNRCPACGFKNIQIVVPQPSQNTLQIHYHCYNCGGYMPQLGTKTVVQLGQPHRASCCIHCQSQNFGVIAGPMPQRCAFCLAPMASSSGSKQICTQCQNQLNVMIGSATVTRWPCAQCGQLISATQASTSNPKICLQCWAANRQKPRSSQQAYYYPKQYRQTFYTTGANMPTGSPTSKVRIWWDRAGFYRVATPYKPGFSEALKACIPGSEKKWDEISKNWCINEGYIKPIQLLCERLWPGEVQLTSRQEEERKATAAVTPTASLDTIIIQFVKLLPYEAMQAAYRKGAMTLHPDRGGDTEKMAALTAAWTRISKEVYKQP